MRHLLLVLALAACGPKPTPAPIPLLPGDVDANTAKPQTSKNTTPDPWAGRTDLLTPPTAKRKNGHFVLPAIVPGDVYFDTVRTCYRVEVRISSEFDAQDPYQPVTPGDLATISFWIGSIGSSSDVVDLASCRRP